MNITKLLIGIGLASAATAWALATGGLSLPGIKPGGLRLEPYSDGELGTVPNVPGLAAREALEPGFIRAFLSVMRETGADPEKMAALMSEESGFNPAAKNSIGAVGLLQWIPQYAKAISGYTPEQIAAMTAIQQLDAVRNTIRKAPGYKTDPPMQGWGSHINAPDDEVIARSGDVAYSANAVYDSDHKGYITAGDVRRAVYASLGKAKALPRLDPNGKAVV